MEARDALLSVLAKLRGADEFTDYSNEGLVGFRKLVEGIMRSIEIDLEKRR